LFNERAGQLEYYMSILSLSLCYYFDLTLCWPKLVSKRDRESVGEQER